MGSFNCSFNAVGVNNRINPTRSLVDKCFSCSVPFLKNPNLARSQALDGTIDVKGSTPIVYTVARFYLPIHFLFFPIHLKVRPLNTKSSMKNSSFEESNVFVKYNLSIKQNIFGTYGIYKLLSLPRS